MYNEINFEAYGKKFRAVSDYKAIQTCISRVQHFTLQEQQAVPYSAVADTFLAITEFARENNLELIGSETRALAFLMNTASVGNLWFRGCID